MRLNSRVWLVYLALFAVAVPWYWHFLAVPPERLFWGVPMWVASAMLGSALISVYTAWLLARPWPQEREEGAGDG